MENLLRGVGPQEKPGAGEKRARAARGFEERSGRGGAHRATPASQPWRRKHAPAARQAPITSSRGRRSAAAGENREHHRNRRHLLRQVPCPASSDLAGGETGVKEHFDVRASKARRRRAPASRRATKSMYFARLRRSGWASPGGVARAGRWRVSSGIDAAPRRTSQQRHAQWPYSSSENLYPHPPPMLPRFSLYFQIPPGQRTPRRAMVCTPSAPTMPPWRVSLRHGRRRQICRKYHQEMSTDGKIPSAIRAWNIPRFARGAKHEEVAGKTAFLFDTVNYISRARGDCEMVRVNHSSLANRRVIE